MIEITSNPIDTAALLAAVADARCGAGVLFVGTTRGVTDGVATARLEYEAYQRMACRVMQRLEEEARQRWPILGCHIVHRTGVVPVGEASVAIAVSSPHRADAFDAARWLIDQLKEQVPIWKREVLDDGRQFWVHPAPTAAPR